MRNYKPISKELLIRSFEVYLETGNQREVSRRTGINRLTLRHNINRCKTGWNMRLTAPESREWGERFEKLDRKLSGKRYN